MSMKKCSNIGGYGGSGSGSGSDSSNSSSSVDELENRVDEYVREMGRETDSKV